MFKILPLSASVLGLAISGWSHACAEIAGVDVPPGGVYVTLEGGFQGTTAPNVAAHGEIDGVQATGAGGSAGAFASAASVPAVTYANAMTITGPGPGVAIAQADSSAPPAQATALAQVGAAWATADPDGGNFIAANDRSYAGFSAGYVLRQQLGAFQRIEIHGSFSSATASQYVPGAAAGLSVDGRTAFASASEGPAYPVASQVRQNLAQDDVIVRFKTGSAGWGTPFAVLFSFEPFFHAMSQSTGMAASMPLADGWFPNVALRDASVEGRFFGAQIAVEASYPFEPWVSWVGRASGGVYFLQAEGSYSDNFGRVSLILDDVRSGGCRLGAESGLRFTLAPDVWLSATGSVDYFSDVPTAELPRELDRQPSPYRLERLDNLQGDGAADFCHPR